MKDLKFTILKRQTEWDIPEVNILSGLIKGLVYRYDKDPSIIVAPGEYPREAVEETLGYGNFEHFIVNDIAETPGSLEQEINNSIANLYSTEA